LSEIELQSFKEFTQTKIKPTFLKRAPCFKS